MPVVNLSISKIKQLLPGVGIDQALDMLPFLGLDIEGQEGDIVRVEYNPNRPDFSSGIGILRGLRGLLGIQTGLPRIRVGGKSGYSVTIDRKVLPVRPIIVAAVADGVSMDNTTIQELISMQEDLHNGLGRSRRKASIGFHNLDSIKFPLRYTVVSRDYRFVPLDESREMTVEQVLTETAVGSQFSHLISDANCPAVIDSNGTTISLPPVVNGSQTRVDSQTRRLFVEVTGLNQKACDDIMAIIVSTLFDYGFKIKTVRIVSSRSHRDTPLLSTEKISTSSRYVNETLGTSISAKELKKCLEKARLGAAVSGDRITCVIPAYRVDIASEIDLVEEAAIGYGITRLIPSLPPSYTTGETSPLSKHLNSIRQSLVGLGFLETVGFSLTNEETQYAPFGMSDHEEGLEVELSKSAEHEILRQSLVPSLLQVLSRNIHETYPQRLFEIGKAFEPTLVENWAFAGVIAHSDSDYTEAKSAAQAVLATAFGTELSTTPTEDLHFIAGRAGKVIVADKAVGVIGEISPQALESFKLRVPVSAFELNISQILAAKSRQ